MSENTMQNVTRHFREVMGEVRIIRVPEWGTEDEPLEIYVWPATIAELARINRQSRQGDYEGVVETLIVRAMNKDRRPIFQLGHRPQLMREANPDVVIRVVAEINDDLSGDVLKTGASGN